MVADASHRHLWNRTSCGTLCMAAPLPESAASFADGTVRVLSMQYWGWACSVLRWRDREGPLSEGLGDGANAPSCRRRSG